VLKLIGFVAEVFGDEQPVFFVREMTKKFEEMHTGTAAEICAAYEGRDVKGECVIVISPDRFVDDRN
jgi:16S rRNA (cytidine1402-2'-O)-methyltransferase